MAINKKDIWPFVVLLALLFAWPVIDRMVAKKFFPNRAAPAVAAAPTESPTNAPVAAEETTLAAAPVEAPAPQPAVEPVAATIAGEEDVGEQPPEQRVTLQNDRIEIVVSSRGGAVVAATLKKYPRTLEAGSPPMVLDFASRPALTYEALGGLGERFDFTLQPGADARSATLERTAANGLLLRRHLELGDGYVVHITDELVNAGAQPLELPPHGLRLGVMRMDPQHRNQVGVVYLGVDTLSPGGEKVQHWGGKIGKFFERERDDTGLATLPVVLDAPPRDNPVDWVAAKDKYFVQILTPDGGGENCRIYARRERSPGEATQANFVQKKMTTVTEVGASVAFAAQTLQPGEQLDRKLTYYVGPKEFNALRAQELRQVEVMEFGMWAPVGKVLLRVLNFIHDHVPPYNYGVAIILLTVIVRVLFWPITHKSTESMRRMQQVSPLVNEIRAKYKAKPQNSETAQKQQQEIMALYKAHKVNPLGGCLPMLVQIPVFIALFVVLRSAIELRFASFLWIHDLSEPENLFPGLLPIEINLLPILMSLTSFLQMKLSPSAGDPAQQKMMAIMMPAMMLVFMYHFASGLALYWTTQNVLMIVQQAVYKNRHTPAPVPAKA